MTLNSPYSIEQMYNERKNGTTISEIVIKTGISRKTWNKRFERYEKRLKMATNNNSEIFNGDKDENVVMNTGDKSQISTRNVANKLLAALAAIAFMLAVYFIYVEIKKRDTLSD